MGILDLIKSRKDKKMAMAYAKMMKGYTPVFNSFGENVYASDIVQNAIRCISTEMSKLDPKHIRTDSSTGLQTVVNSEISRLLKFGPNPIMSTSDFLEKITYLREVEKNVYIYPTYREIPLSDGSYKRIYTGLYPLNPTTVEYLEDSTGRVFIRFYFADNTPYTFPYSSIIHWRKDFFSNDFTGGESLTNESLLKLLKVNDTITQGLDHGVKSSLTIKGILKINTMMDDDKQREERERFEAKMMDMQNGILPVDLKNEFTPINIDPKVIDKETMEFIDKRILAYFGVPLCILNGDFTEMQYQSFYEKTLEPMIISLGRAFYKLFTQRELEVGNEIIFYNQGLQFMNTANKIAAVDILSRIGTLTDNQILAIFGYPPFEGGDVRNKSLNYINRDIADQYQLSNNSKTANNNNNNSEGGEGGDEKEPKRT